MFIEPTVTDFKAYFTRDFPYSATTTDLTKVLVTDIQKAIAKAAMQINESLFTTQATYNIGFYYLTAHFLVLDLLNSNQGLAGQYSWLMTNKSVGSVAAGYAIPEYIMKTPLAAMLCKTTYGAQYLELLMTQLVGNIAIAYGTTTP